MILWSEDRRAHDFGIVDAGSSFALPGLYDNRAELLFPPLRVHVPPPWRRSDLRIPLQETAAPLTRFEKVADRQKLDHFASQRRRLLLIT
jgi:hypothetical protein